MTESRPSSDRIRRRVERDFAPHEHAAAMRTLDALLPDDEPRGRERIHAAVLVVARGRLDHFERAAREVAIDWRDVLMAADLGFDDWPRRVDAFLDGD